MSYEANSVDFSACAGQIAGVRVEATYCGRCRRMYFRTAVPVKASSPPSLCRDCDVRRARATGPRN